MSDGGNGVSFEGSEQAGSGVAAKPYLLPFRHAVRELGLASTELPDRFEVTKEQFIAFLTVILRGVPFNEKWYLASYPDIAEAVRSGHFRSAKDHFVEHGYREDRHPERVVVDEKWYKSEYPDIAESVEVGEIKSCQDHFDLHGQSEGRFPFKV